MWWQIYLKYDSRQKHTLSKFWVFFFFVACVCVFSFLNMHTCSTRYTLSDWVCALFVFIVLLSESYSLFFHSQKGDTEALSSCSGRLWSFHVDDWFRCAEEGKEGSGCGLCPLITLYYHTGGIYHQTPKASVHGEHWNQSLRLHAIHPGPRKAALLSATTSIYSVRGGCSQEKVRGKEQKGKERFEATLR